MPAWQSNSGIRPPRVFLPINDEHAGEQLNLVTEELERNRARQKGCVHEHTVPERQFAGHWLWLVE